MLIGLGRDYLTSFEGEILPTGTTFNDFVVQVGDCDIRSVTNYSVYFESIRVVTRGPARVESTLVGPLACSHLVVVTGS